MILVSIGVTSRIRSKPAKKAKGKHKLAKTPGYINYHCRMTSEEARLMIIDGINYAAYKETDFSLHDSDKNRLFGSEHYNSGREVVKPSPWAEGDFEEKMAMLLRWANALNRSDPAFAQAQSLLEAEESLIGRVIRRTKAHEGQNNRLFFPQATPKISRTKRPHRLLDCDHVVGNFVGKTENENESKTTPSHVLN
jgi:hypothetical protein